MEGVCHDGNGMGKSTSHYLYGHEDQRNNGDFFQLWYDDLVWLIHSTFIINALWKFKNKLSILSLKFYTIIINFI